MQGEIRRRIKFDAKMRLSGNWGTAIGIVLIVYFISFALSLLEQGYAALTGNQTMTQTLYNMISDAQYGYSYMPYLPAAVVAVSGIFAVVSFLLTTPLQVGAASWYMSLSAGRPAGLSQLFSWFESAKRYFTTLGTALVVYVKCLAFMILPLIVMVPTLIYLVIGNYKSSEASIMIAAILFILSYVAFLVLAIYASIRYSFSFYLLAMNPELGANTATKLSAQISKGHIWEAFVFDLSFLGWYLLAGITCGLVSLYVTPYQTASFALFTRYLHTDYMRKNGMNGYEQYTPGSSFGQYPQGPAAFFGQNPYQNQDPYQNPQGPFGQNPNHSPYDQNPYGQQNQGYQNPYQNPNQQQGNPQPPYGNPYGNQNDTQNSADPSRDGADNQQNPWDTPQSGDGTKEDDKR